MFFFILATKENCIYSPKIVNLPVQTYKQVFARVSNTSTFAIKSLIIQKIHEKKKHL